MAFSFVNRTWYGDRNRAGECTNTSRSPGARNRSIGKKQTTMSADSFAKTLFVWNPKSLMRFSCPTEPSGQAMATPGTTVPLNAATYFAAFSAALKTTAEATEPATVSSRTVQFRALHVWASRS